MSGWSGRCWWRKPAELIPPLVLASDLQRGVLGPYVAVW